MKAILSARDFAVGVCRAGPIITAYLVGAAPDDLETVWTVAIQSSPGLRLAEGNVAP
jgi:hypothetical protein